MPTLAFFKGAFLKEDTPSLRLVPIQVGLVATNDQF